MRSPTGVEDGAVTEQGVEETSQATGERDHGDVLAAPDGVRRVSAAGRRRLRGSDVAAVVSPCADTVGSAGSHGAGQREEVRPVGLDNARPDRHETGRPGHGVGYRLATLRSDRRIGFAIRYVSTGVRQMAGERDSAILVRGGDEYHHFEPAVPPAKDCDPEALARHSALLKRRARVLYRGTEIDAFK